MTDYNSANAHQRDKMITFDAENHRYTAGDITFKSVTTLVEECFEKFDTDYWAQRAARKQGLPVSVIKAQWEAKAERARNLGTLMHDKIERYYLGEEPESDDTFRLFEQFASNVKLSPYRTEWAIFDEESRIAGTLDFLHCDDGEFRIYDWKRSDKIIENGVPVRTNRYGKTALRLIAHIPDTTYWHYALQVSIYRYILEKNYNINVKSGHLVVLHPSNTTYYVVNVPYLRTEVETLLRQQ